MEWTNPLVFLAIGAVLIAIGRWVGGMERFRSSVEDTIKIIQEDIKKIFERLPPPDTVGSNSPRTLSDFGKEVSEHIKAHEWAGEKGSQLIDQVRGKEPYEIETFSFAYVDSLAVTSEAFSTEIQKCSYEKERLLLE